MFYYNEKEIKTTLRLYTISKIKVKELKCFEAKKTEEETLEINNHLAYYEHIIKTVECWLKEMTLDEVEIIELRFFKNLTYDAISIKLGYSNHSAVLKKCNDIIKMIKNQSIKEFIYK